MAASILKPLSMMLLLLAVFSVGSGIASSCPAHCKIGWTYYGKTDTCCCYKQFFGANFEVAENICKKHDGHLASIHSSEENVFVAALAETGKNWTKHTDYTWIGLRQANLSNSEEWTWTDGTPVDYLAWAEGQPNNKGGHEDCAQVFGDRETWPYQKWNDAECNLEMRSFICKKRTEIVTVMWGDPVYV